MVVKKHNKRYPHVLLNIRCQNRTIYIDGLVQHGCNSLFYKFHFFTVFVSLYINTSTVKILKDFKRNKVGKMSFVQRLYLKQGQFT